MYMYRWEKTEEFPFHSKQLRESKQGGQARREQGRQKNIESVTTPNDKSEAGQQNTD